MIKPFDAKFCANEREVESKLIVSYLLPALGYHIDMWQQEKTFNRFRLDFLAIPQGQNFSNQLIIEAKHPDKNLNECTAQLNEYLLTIKIKYGLLTNGREIRIYETHESKVRLIFNCYVNQLESKLEEIKALIGRETLSVPPPIFRDHNSMKVIAIYHNLSSTKLI